MALLISKAISAYAYLERELADPRTQDWFLVGNTWLVLGIIAFYLAFVLYLGPMLMKNREPVDLKTFLFYHNFFKLAVSAYIFKEALSVYFNGYSLTCEPIDWSDDPKALRIAKGVWFYYMVKLIDLLDTVMYVLMKKSDTVSFLHLYYHGGMAFTSHIITKYMPGGQVVFLGLINSAVVVVVHAYLLSLVWDSTMIRWRKCVTQLQTVQFLMYTIHWLLPLFLGCGYPIEPLFFMIPQNLSLLYFFWQFYVSRYITKRPRKVKTEEEKNTAKAD